MKQKLLKKSNPTNIETEIVKKKNFTLINPINIETEIVFELK